MLMPVNLVAVQAVSRMALFDDTLKVCEELDRLGLHRLHPSIANTQNDAMPWIVVLYYVDMHTYVNDSSGPFPDCLDGCQSLCPAQW